MRLLEQRQAEDAATLTALREAARLGIAAMDSGDVRSFAATDELMAYLDEVADKAIGDAS